MYPLDDTIAAIASPPGGAARGIVRLSGPQAIDCLAQFFQPATGRPLRGSGASSRTSLPARCGCRSFTRRFRATCISGRVRSYTGQPVVEIHTLGSPPLLEIVLRSICAAGARLAGPGEFTLRAFLAGRIDLTQAEAVLGVIDAGDRHELEIALGQLAGGLARPAAPPAQRTAGPLGPRGSRL